MNKEDYVKICPRCGSVNVSVDSLNASAFDFCKDCGFGREPDCNVPFLSGNFPEVKMSQIKAFRKNLKGNKTNKQKSTRN